MPQAVHRHQPVQLPERCCYDLTADTHTHICKQLLLNTANGAQTSLDAFTAGVLLLLLLPQRCSCGIPRTLTLLLNAVQVLLPTQNLSQTPVLLIAAWTQALLLLTQRQLAPLCLLLPAGRCSPCQPVQGQLPAPPPSAQLMLLKNVEAA
jgi:hypothetical protein